MLKARVRSESLTTYWLYKDSCVRSHINVDWMHLIAEFDINKSRCCSSVKVISLTSTIATLFQSNPLVLLAASVSGIMTGALFFHNCMSYETFSLFLSSFASECAALRLGCVPAWHNLDLTWRNSSIVFGGSENAHQGCSPVASENPSRPE